MYDWLKTELQEVKTPGFHIVGGANHRLRRAIQESDLPLPASYKEFVQSFGEAKLYRDPGSNAYRVGVFAGPREVVRADLGTTYQIGYYDDSPVYVKSAIGLDERGESPVYEGWAAADEPAADTFEQWLRYRCDDARRRFGAERWKEIVRGPAPFTENEHAIVAARKCFKWHVTGEAANGDLVFEVRNESSRTLPSLSLGVRSKDGALNGVIHLPVASVLPGQTGVLEFDCYKQFYPACKIEVFELPSPGPQDRERYWEFRGR